MFVFEGFVFVVCFFSSHVVADKNCTGFLHCSWNNSLESQVQPFGINNYSLSSRVACPPWYRVGYDGSCCKGRMLNGVIEFREGTRQTWLQRLYCMTTHGNGSNRADVVGGCLFSLRHFSSSQPSYPLPCKISLLNKRMCGGWNREGQLCGRCVKGFAPPVYSYSLACVNCTDYHLNWLKYIGVAFGPLTLFCLSICFFHISATSPYLYGYVFLCQVLTSPTALRIADLKLDSNRNIIASKLYLSVMSIWNLDFFSLFYKPFCLHPKMTIVQALTLNYLVALYPLVLLLVVWLFVKLHSQNVTVIVALWRPFRALHRPFLRNLNVKSSLIESFATLYFLSAMKIQSVSVDLLVPTALFLVDGSHKSMYLYLAGDVEYFGSEHLFYGLLAFFCLAIITVLPGLLLFLYPCGFFQKFLNKMKCNFVGLRIFMDVFQGSYKNGTNGTRDYRFFSGVFFFTRFILVTNFVVLNSAFFLMVSGVVITALGFSVAILRPQRTYSHYILDCFICMIFTFALFSLIGFSLPHVNTIPTKIVHFFLDITLSLPVVYVTGLMGYWIFIKKRIPQNIVGFVTKIAHRNERHCLLNDVQD